MSGLGRAILAPLCLFFVAAAADEPKDAKAPDWRERIQKKLSQPISFEFADTPAEETLSFFQGILGETIIVDPAAADLAKRPVRMSVQGVPTGKALSDLLSQAGLRVSLKDEALLVEAIPGGKAEAVPPPPAGKTPAPAGEPGAAPTNRISG